MSINGSGRFSRRRESEVSVGSSHSNFSMNLQQPSFEPATGTTLMAQSGWILGDPYRKPLAGAPAAPNRSVGLGAPISSRKFANSSSTQQQIKFERSPDYKTIYLIGLIVMSILLIGLIFLIIILFVTKVFVMNPVPSVQLNTTSLVPPNPSPHPLLPPHSPPLQQTSPHTTALSPNGGTIPNNNNNGFKQPENSFGQTGQNPTSSNSWTHISEIGNNGGSGSGGGAIIDQLQKRIFECDFYINEQANPAYDNVASFEYNQARQIIQNALSTMVDASTLRDLSPLIIIDKLNNEDKDLHVFFSLTILVLTNSSVRAEIVRNVLLNETAILENLLNNTTVDRQRIAVKMRQK